MATIRGAAPEISRKQSTATDFCPRPWTIGPCRSLLMLAGRAIAPLIAHVYTHLYSRI